MTKTVLRKLLILILIGLLLGLALHGHYDSAWDGDDGHCVFCQLLVTGFTFSLVFYLRLYFVKMLFPKQTAEFVYPLEPCFDRPLRGPPLNPLF